MASMRTASPLAVQFCWMALDSFQATGQSPNRANIVAFLVQDPTQKLSLNEEEARKHLDLVLEDKALRITNQNLYEMPDFSHINSSKSTHDWYCFECHHPGKVIHCTHCHRVFHQNCLLDKFPPSKSSSTYLCHICKQLTMAERESANHSRSSIRHLLKIALKKVESKNAWSTLQLIGYLDQKDRNDYIFYKYIDTKMIRERVNSEHYKSMNHLLADVEQLMHNIYVMYGPKDDMLSMARSLLRDLETEHKEMSFCVHCYKMDRMKIPDAMVKPCPNRHSVIWAQRTGSMFWPCKVLTKSLDGSYEVKAFGGKHERSNIPKDRACVWEDVNPSDLGVRTTPALKKAIAEMEKYKTNLAEYEPPIDPSTTDDVITEEDVPSSDKRSFSSTNQKKSASSKGGKKRKLNGPIVVQESNDEDEREKSKRIRSNSSFSSSLSSPEPMSPCKSSASLNNGNCDGDERYRQVRVDMTSPSPKNTPNKSFGITISSQQASVAASSVHSREMSQSPGSVASSNCRQISTTTVSPSRQNHNLIDSVGQLPSHSRSNHASSNTTTPQHTGYASSSKECTPPASKPFAADASRYNSSRNIKIESPTITSSSFSPPENGPTSSTLPGMANNANVCVTAVGTKLKINRHLINRNRRKTSTSSSDLSSTDSDSSSDEDNDAIKDKKTKASKPPNIKKRRNSLIEELSMSPQPPDVTQEEFSSQNDKKEEIKISKPDLLDQFVKSKTSTSQIFDKKSSYSPNKPVSKLTETVKEEKTDRNQPIDKFSRDSSAENHPKSRKVSPVDHCISSSTPTKEMLTAELTPIIEARVKATLEAQLRQSIEDQVRTRLEGQLLSEYDQMLAKERAKWSEERAALLRQHEEQIRQTKRGSWCVGCLEQAKYYCCTSNTMNNSYCSQACLEAHWHNGHQHTCRRRRR